jgi:hypothetical protein
MKRKILFFVMLLAVLGFSTMQSCKKDAVVTPKEYVAAMPEAPVPAVDAVVPFTGTGQAITLEWTGTATNAIKWDVYFGDTDAPDLVASAQTTNSYTAHVTAGGTYYWGVVTVDANNVESASEVWSFQVNSNPGAANTPVPALNATAISCNPAMSWKATDPEEDDLTYDLFLGTAAVPTTIAATGLTDAAFTVAATLTPNTVYYWKVVAHDPFGGSSVSPIWKFTTGALPINTFVGLYNTDEPAEAYSYDVSFTFGTASTIKTTNYWNSGWPATFTIDFDKLTYTMSSYTFSAGWTGVESGIINKTTGKMVGTYTLWLNGVIQEQGVHTYTKK